MRIDMSAGDYQELMDTLLAAEAERDALLAERMGIVHDTALMMLAAKAVREENVQLRTRLTAALEALAGLQNPGGNRLCDAMDSVLDETGNAVVLERARLRDAVIAEAQARRQHEYTFSNNVVANLDSKAANAYYATENFLIHNEEAALDNLNEFEAAQREREAQK